MARKIVNLTNEYSKPEKIEIIVHGFDKFVVFESVLHSLMETMGFKRDGGEVSNSFVRFEYKPTRKKK